MDVDRGQVMEQAVENGRSDGRTPEHRPAAMTLVRAFPNASQQRSPKYPCTAPVCQRHGGASHLWSRTVGRSDPLVFRQEPARRLIARMLHPGASIRLSRSLAPIVATSSG
jgi:hypothetical protein